MQSCVAPCSCPNGAIQFMESYPGEECNDLDREELRAEENWRKRKRREEEEEYRNSGIYNEEDEDGN